MFSARIGLKKTVLTILAMASSSVWATTKNYVGPNNSNFNTSGNWSPTGVPAGGDDVYLGNENPTNATGNFTVTINTTTAGLDSLTLNSYALPAYLIVNQTAGTLTALTMNVGTTTSENTYNQSGGSTVAVNTLNIGVSSGLNNYNISGSGTLLYTNNFDDINVGVSGSGTFTQSIGTTVEPSGDLILGVNAGGSGTYTMTGGELECEGYVEVGDAGTGSFSQSGGDVDCFGIDVTSTNGTATYNFSGGTIEATGLDISSNGTFNLQTGGNLLLVPEVDSGGVFKMAGGSFGSTGGIDLEGGTFELLGYNPTLAFFESFTGGTTSNGASTPAVLTVDMRIVSAGPTSYYGNIQDGSNGSLGLTVTGGAAYGLGLGGTNTYSGPTTVAALLQAEAANVFSPNSAVTVMSGGTLDANTFAGTIGSLAGTAGIVNVNTGGNLSIGSLNTSTYFAGQITGSGTITKIGTGTLTLNGGGAFTGTIAIAGGTLGVNIANGIPTAATVNFTGIGGTLSVNANQSLAALSSGDLNLISFSNNPTLTVGTNNGNSIISGNFTGAGTLLMAGTGTYSIGLGDNISNTDGSVTIAINSGTLDLDKAAGATAVAGSLNINGGTVSLLASNQISDSSYVTMSGGTFNLNGNVETIGGLNGTAGTLNLDGGGLTINNTIVTAFSGNVVSTSGEIVENGSAGLTLANTASFQGQFVVNSGQLILQGIVASSNYVVYAGGTLEFLNAQVNNPGAEIYVNPGGTVEYSGGTISNAYLRGGGTQLVLANTKFNGVTTYNSTVITQNGLATFTDFTNGGTFNNNAMLTFNGATNETSGIINVNSTINFTDFTNNGVINIASGASITSTGSTLYLGGGSRVYIGTSANPGGAINLTNGATLEVNGALLVNDGTISGTTDVNYGGTAEGTGTYGPVNVTFGGVFQPGISSTSIIAGNNTSVSALSGDGTIDNVAAAGNITLNVNTSVANSFSGTIQNSNGTLGLNLNGGSLTLLTHPVSGGNSINTYSGGTTITSGSLIIGAINAFPAGTPVLDNGSFLIYANSTIGQITGSGNLTVGSNTATAIATLAPKSGISTLATLTINTGSKLDVTNNDLIIHNGTLSQTAALIASAYHAGAWDGATGITSSLAAISAHGSVTLGVGTGLSSFDGQSVLPTDILVKYTWLGDANLDGIVNSSDLSAMSSAGTTWQTGDFNYDGKVNADDYALYMLGNAESGGVNISSTLPEPGILLAASGLVLATMSRGRRR
jgi:fibronectin-binding autotransporter adhesin